MNRIFVLTEKFGVQVFVAQPHSHVDICTNEYFPYPHHLPNAFWYFPEQYLSSRHNLIFSGRKLCEPHSLSKYDQQKTEAANREKKELLLLLRNLELIIY